jgi:hypothetical protein
MLLWRFMDEAERGTNRWIPKRAQPSRRSFRLFSQPRPEGLDEQDNGQTGDDRGRAHDLMVGFTSDKSHVASSHSLPARSAFGTRIHGGSTDKNDLASGLPKSNAPQIRLTAVPPPPCRSTAATPLSESATAR